MRNYILCSLLALLLAFEGYTQTANQQAVTALLERKDTDERLIKDIKYGSHDRNVMDVYLPAARTANTVFVVNIHGGAWTQGDKSFDEPLAKYLLSQGIAVANINYRYADDKDTHLPELLDDVDSVVHYLVQHAAEWNTRTTGFSVSGASSGAHVVMMYAYTRNPKIKAIVELCGPVDFTDTLTLQHLYDLNLAVLVDKMTGNTSKESLVEHVPPLYAANSPIKHVKNIPILIVHGDQDEVVPIRQANLLVEKLKSNDIPHQFLLIPNAGHNLSADEETKKKIFAQVATWLTDNGTN